MKRKVIQRAGKTLVISLPHEWADRYSIKKGDEVDLSDDGSCIKISTQPKGKIKKTISINLSNASRTVTRAVLSGIYKQGYDEISVMHNSKEVYDAIQEKKREVLLGFTIHETNSNTLVLGSFMNDSPDEFENSLRRAFLVTISMGENLLNAIKNKDARNLKDIRTGENTNNQLTSFCERLINKGFVDKNKASFYYVICWNLEKVCDPYRDIIFIIEENGNKMQVSKDTIALFEMVNSYLKKYYDTFYNYSLSKITSLEDDKKEIISCASKIYQNKPEFECKIINCLFEIAALSSNFSGPVNALNLNKLTSK